MIRGRDCRMFYDFERDVAATVQSVIREFG